MLLDCSRTVQRLALISAAFILAVPCAGRPLLAAAATVIAVPSSQPTIQAAINAAQNGDTVVVAPGTYYENLNFDGKAVTVESSSGPGATIIDGRSLGPVVTFGSGEGPASVLQGFTLQHGQANLDGGGISIGYASPTIVGNVITGNTACDGGGGIAASFASPVIRGNTITGNGQAGCSGGVGGGGIEVRGAGSTQMIGNTISNNSWGTADGGGISLFAAGTPTIEDNVISANTAGGAGGGIYAVNQSDATIVQNLITGNSAPGGAALYSLPPSGTRGPWLVNNTMTGNTGSNGTILLDGFDQQVQLWNNLVVGTVVCQTTYQTTPPGLFANDVYASGGQAYLGACSGESGSSGDISADPLFVSATTGNYHLQSGSPAIDAGNRTAPSLPATDLDGNIRVEGFAVDQGAYEYPGPVPPGPVGNLAATAGIGQATVSWTAPASTGGSPITGYAVTPYLGTSAQPVTTVAASAVSATISGLANGATYTFTVTATNALGSGPATSSNAVTLPTVPGSVTNLKVTTGPKQTATVTWSAPLSDGGSPVTQYSGSAVSTGGSHTFSVPPAQMSVSYSNINPKVKWTFTVSATNAVGTGPSASVVVAPH
jgi:Right handed beta helix region/Fibronectin type III domain